MLEKLGWAPTCARDGQLVVVQSFLFCIAGGANSFECLGLHLPFPDLGVLWVLEYVLIHEGDDRWIPPCLLSLHIQTTIRVRVIAAWAAEVAWSAADCHRALLLSCCLDWPGRMWVGTARPREDDLIRPIRRWVESMDIVALWLRALVSGQLAPGEARMRQRPRGLVADVGPVLSACWLLQPLSSDGNHQVHAVLEGSRLVQEAARWCPPPAGAVQAKQLTEG